MQSTKRLNQVSARPRAVRHAPRYPRQVLLVAAAWSASLAACASAPQHASDPGGAMPYPHDSTTVHVATPPSRFAQPPPDDVVEPIEDVDDDSDDSDVVQPPGEAPMPYE